MDFTPNISDILASMHLEMISRLHIINIVKPPLMLMSP